MVEYFCFYQMSDGKLCRAISSKTNEIKTVNFNDMPERRFKMDKYSDTDDNLRTYMNKFTKMCNELSNNDIKNFDYQNSYGHMGAVWRFFRIMTKKETEKYEFENADAVEHKWMKRSNNGGITNGDIGYRGMLYTHDFNMTYPNAMISPTFRISTKRGREKTLKKFKTDKKGKITLKCGYYHVKIQTDNKDILKVFVFSKDNVYTQTSLDFAIRNKDKYNLTIEIVHDGEPNAYLYYDDDLVYTHKIFTPWIEPIMKLRKKFPENDLIKNLASKLYGYLKKKNIIYKTIDEINDENLDVGLCGLTEYTFEDVCNDDIQKIYKTDDPFKSPFARMQPMIASFVRNKIGYFVMEHQDKVKRVCIDSVSFSENVDVSRQKNIKLEKKSTGFIEIVSRTRFINYCDVDDKILNNKDLCDIYKKGLITYNKDITKANKIISEIFHSA